MARFKDFATLTVRVAAVISALFCVSYVAWGEYPNSNGAATKTTAADTVKNEQDGILWETFNLWKMPEFPGGDRAIYNYMRDVMIYPPEALKDSIEGRVIVEFVIDETGKVTNARVVRGRHPALDKEALRIVNSMPDWSPGIKEYNGSPSKVTYHLPVTFRLKDQCQDKK